MNLRALLLAAVSCFATIQAEVTWINHDQVQPFAQPEPATDSETAAVKFKPFLEVSYGCEPYPAVSANGSVSASLKWTGKNDGDCEGSALGSQVYSRSDWYKDKWAMMYAWYFPKGWQGASTVSHRHLWLHAVVWIDNPALDNSTILAVSTPVKLDASRGFWASKMLLKLTTDKGESQDLITWDQMTEEARTALSEANFDKHLFKRKNTKVPFKDGVFTDKLKKA
ncbi:necrosis inducing-like protein NPP1 type [Phytophthora sojae]|uniref:Necrosis inducing-like protein NPP1 type n=1 Tax=Phytophthora sojae (strain P6497) TaxID=1094619 RepID=G5A8R9_PHYSP|nr:necrosis inducing-like protein NPP1 type [Phytophthora sojae]EGZ08295.1 necrosis inducing-like protein NPP1 type [Phytophthora sojae]|eukprot:XP_009536467.1 necrosis inducing-like protein NPP1 type [Phytophthora sojae]